jgi:hypothetical protein
MCVDVAWPSQEPALHPSARLSAPGCPYLAAGSHTLGCCGQHRQHHHGQSWPASALRSHSPWPWTAAWPRLLRDAWAGALRTALAALALHRPPPSRTMMKLMGLPLAASYARAARAKHCVNRQTCTSAIAQLVSRAPMNNCLQSPLQESRAHGFFA